MHNCLILGCGRSGTSLTGGLLNKAGYYFGSNPIEARDANPKGFFEDHLINYVNERIMLERVRYARLPPWLYRALGRTPYQPAQLWLSVLEEPVQWNVAKPLQWIMRDLVSHEPYAYKDPRFSYTLNAWRPYLKQCRMICVFRHPSVAVASIAKEVASEPFYQNLAIGAEHALRVWAAMYRQILDFHCTDDAEWLFIEYDQLIAGTAFDPISRFLNVEIDAGFLDQNLNRSRPDETALTSDVRDIYERLQAKADTTQEAAMKPA